MQFGAVTFVPAETILRKLRAELTHNPIARDLGDDARSRDRFAVTIAVDHRGLRQRKRNDGQAVDQDVFRRGDERGDRVAHGPMGRAQNIDPVDLEVIDHAHGPRDFAVAGKIDIDFLAQLRSELFGIVQLSVPKFFRKNYGRGDHRAG
jgi:hypothetical protein